MCPRFYINDMWNSQSKTVLLKCDNVAAIESFSRGAARDTYPAAISRAMWYCLARADVNPIYQYTPGHLMSIPDALSRMHISPHHYDQARAVVHQLDVSPKPFHYLHFHDFLKLQNYPHHTAMQPEPGYRRPIGLPQEVNIHTWCACMLA